MALVRELHAAKVRGAADFDPGVQVRPACILWPDGERQWEPAIPALQKYLPEPLVPGFSRSDLRAVESCPEPLVPLAELQYRGTI